MGTPPRFQLTSILLHLFWKASCTGNFFMRNISFIKNLPQITNVNEVCMYCKRFEKLENVIIHQNYFVLIWQICVSLSKGRKLHLVDKNTILFSFWFHLHKYLNCIFSRVFKNYFARLLLKKEEFLVKCFKCSWGLRSWYYSNQKIKSVG